MTIILTLILAVIQVALIVSVGAGRSIAETALRLSISVLCGIVLAMILRHARYKIRRELMLYKFCIDCIMDLKILTARQKEKENKTQAEEFEFADKEKIKARRKKNDN